METEVGLWLEVSMGCKEMEVMKEEGRRCVSAEMATKSSACMNAPLQFLHSCFHRELGLVS